MLASTLLGAAAAESPPGTDVDGLLALARQLNPDLAAAALEREQALARIVPAAALDDPTLNFSRDQSTRQTTVTLSQDFPLWGKRSLRRTAAEADATAAKGRQDSVALELEERVKDAFAQYYALSRSIGATEKIEALLRTLSDTTRARYAQGLTSQSDALRAELERTRLGPQLAALERDRQTVKARINALIAQPIDAALAEPATLRPVPPASSLHFNQLAARAQEASPDLAAARAEITAADAERRLVDKSWLPDVTVSLGGSDMPNISPRLVAGLGIKVPLQWGVRDAQAQAAGAKKAEASSRLESATLRIRSDLAAALASLAEAQKTRELLARALTPQSEAAYGSALAAYERGRGDLTAALDAARRRLEIRLELLRAEAEEQNALAALERLVGGRL